MVNGRFYSGVVPMRLLSGWKEIATHMNHGVRTVQRWEIIGLPVHRTKGAAHSKHEWTEEEMAQFLTKASQEFDKRKG